MRTNARASARRSSLAADSITRIMEGSFPDAVPGHRERSRHAIVQQRIQKNGSWFAVRCSLLSGDAVRGSPSARSFGGACYGVSLRLWRAGSLPRLSVASVVRIRRAPPPPRPPPTAAVATAATTAHAAAHPAKSAHAAASFVRRLLQLWRLDSKADQGPRFCFNRVRRVGGLRQRHLQLVDRIPLDVPGLHRNPRCHRRHEAMRIVFLRAIHFETIGRLGIGGREPWVPPLRYRRSQNRPKDGCIRHLRAR